MERLCGQFGLDVSRHLPRLHELADRTEGWPRHLFFAAVPLANASRAVDGDTDRIDWVEVEAQAKASRQRHYRDQRSPETRDADILTAKVMVGLRPGMRLRELRALVRGIANDEPGYELPEGMTDRGFIQHLVERGALYDGRDAGFHSPISAFQAYLVGDGFGPRDPGGERDRDRMPAEATTADEQDGPGCDSVPSARRGPSARSPREC